MLTLSAVRMAVRALGLRWLSIRWYLNCAGRRRYAARRGLRHSLQGWRWFAIFLGGQVFVFVRLRATGLGYSGAGNATSDSGYGITLGRLGKPSSSFASRSSIFCRRSSCGARRRSLPKKSSQWPISNRRGCR